MACTLLILLGGNCKHALEAKQTLSKLHRRFLVQMLCVLLLEAMMCRHVRVLEQAGRQADTCDESHL